MALPLLHGHGRDAYIPACTFTPPRAAGPGAALYYVHLIYDNSVKDHKDDWSGEMMLSETHSDSNQSAKGNSALSIAQRGIHIFNTPAMSLFWGSEEALRYRGFSCCDMPVRQLIETRRFRIEVQTREAGLATTDPYTNEPLRYASTKFGLRTSGRRQRRPKPCSERHIYLL